MKIKKKYLSVFALVAIAGIVLPLKVDYKVYSTGKIFPEQEWVLGRTEDGRIISTIKNNHLGVISSYGGKEFQRGDVFDFDIEPGFLQKRFVKKGERVGNLQSNDLKRMLVDLEGQLKVEKALLGVYSTGQKSAVVKEAQTSCDLALEQFEIQKKLLERKRELYKDSLLAPQEYDLALNQYETCRINYELAKARLLTVSTGEKPEQIRFSHQRIVALENQIISLKERLASLEITSPFSGKLLHKKAVPSIIPTNAPYVDILAHVADTSTYIIVTPIQLKDAKYVAVGQKVKLQLFNSDTEMEAEITHIDNVIQIVNGKQAMFATAVVTHKSPELLPGIIAQTAVVTGEVTIYDYGKRLFAGLFFR